MQGNSMPMMAPRGQLGHQQFCRPYQKLLCQKVAMSDMLSPLESVPYIFPQKSSSQLRNNISE